MHGGLHGKSNEPGLSGLNAGLLTLGQHNSHEFVDIVLYLIPVV